MMSSRFSTLGSMSLKHFINKHFVRVRGCAGASRPLVRVLRVVHVVLGVRRWLGPRGKVK